MNIDWPSFVLGGGFGFLLSAIMVHLVRRELMKRYNEP